MGAAVRRGRAVRLDSGADPANCSAGLDFGAGSASRFVDFDLGAGPASRSAGLALWALPANYPVNLDPDPAADSAAPYPDLSY